MENIKDLDWSNLGFSYRKTNYRYISHWKDGAWDDGELVTDNKLNISEASTALHYGQQCFEGMKAYRTKDGSIQLFRADKNALRMQDSCERILMPKFPVDRFIDACFQVVKANQEYVPPYGTGATLYLRPFMIGVGDCLNVTAAPEFIFSIFVSPVGPYFKKGFKPVNLITTEFDRAAPNGTGDAKVGGNYAGSLLPYKLAKEEGYADCVYLDPATHTKIEEVGAANFFAITKDNVFVTPKSKSVLPSITKYSLLHIAKEYLNLETAETDIYIDELDKYKEAGACGTAAVITPIGSINHKGKVHTFYSEDEAGPISQKLYDTLYGIQIGDVEAPKGWIFKVK